MTAWRAMTFSLGVAESWISIIKAWVTKARPAGVIGRPGAHSRIARAFARSAAWRMYATPRSWIEQSWAPLSRRISSSISLLVRTNGPTFMRRIMRTVF